MHHCLKQKEGREEMGKKSNYKSHMDVVQTSLSHFHSPIMDNSIQREYNPIASSTDNAVIEFKFQEHLLDYINLAKNMLLVKCVITDEK